MRRAVLAAFLVLLGAAPAHAATFQVNTAADSAVCNAVACSLRGAITAAQANGAAEDDVINVPAGTYATPEVTMNGPNASRITIAGAGANTTFWQPVGTNRMLTVSGSGPTDPSVTVRDLTLRNGRPASGGGGNVYVSGGGLALVGVRVTAGQAPTGGGIRVTWGSLGGAVTLTRSLVDGNTATGTGGSDGGGGITLEAGTGPSSLTVTDSTIANNTAPRGGAVLSSNSSPLTLRGATIAGNHATLSGVGGALQLQLTPPTAQGSIIAGNTAMASLAAVEVPSNCVISSGTTTDQGGNIDSLNQCGFASASSLRNTNPQLATTLDATQQPPTLSVPETSPAVDFATCDASRPTDQRGMTRTLGARCDSGAYEFDPRPDTGIQGSAPPLTLTSTDANSTFECDLDGAGFTACASPYSPAAAVGTHTLSVRAIDPQGNVDPTPATTTFTVQPPVPTATPTTTPTPTPVVNKTVIVREIRGTVKVKRPGRKSFENLDSTQGIPVGSTVDTKDGRVELTSVPKAGAPPEKATFYDGIFKVTQSKGITNLTLTEALAPCPKGGKAAAAAKKPKTRKLWGDGKGKFRTSGKYSAATVRGTKWLVQDSCAGTLTRVAQGTVNVRDKVKQRTIVLRAKKSYTARPKR